MVFKILLFAFIGMMSCGVHAGSLDKPYTFSDTQLLSASKVNSNFQALSLGITELESRLIPLDAGTRTWSGIPYTFVGGARALASEIRSNYSTAASGVQALRDRVQALDSISGSWDGVPHTITAGQSATQTVLNDNFDVLFTELNTLQDRVSAIESSAANQAPKAALSVAPTSGDRSTSFQFDASNSSDSEDANSVLQVRWDWDGDSNWDTAYSTVKVVSHSFPDVNTYTVQVQVKDSEGLTDSISRQVEVGAPNQAPMASFTVSPSSGDTSSNFQFDASGSTDSEDAMGVLQVRWDWDGDSNWDTAYSTSKTTTHSFSFANTYTVQAQVKDSAGLTNITSRHVAVNVPNQAPTAAFKVFPSSGDTGTSFQFDASDSSDFEDGNSALQVRWDWDGDSNWDTAYASTKTASHTFSSAATYSVKMEVKDTGGLTATTTHSVTVDGAHGITKSPVISSPSHIANTSSTDSNILVSWTAATSGIPGTPITYEYLLDSTATHPHGSFTSAKSNAASTRAGQLIDTLSWQFTSLDDGTYYFHLRAYDSAGIVSGTAVINFGPLVLDSKPTLGSTPISPSSGDYSKAITVLITGSKFMSNATVKLVNGVSSAGNQVFTLSDVTLTNVSVDSANQITATVPADTTPGMYDLSVSNGAPHNQPVTSMKSYTSTQTTIAVDETYTNTLGMAFKQIPAGTFTMGSPSTESGRWSSEGPQHQVTISQPFFMQTTEVTQGQWQAVMGSNPSSFSSCGTDCPVETVSWNDIQTFLTTINQRGEGTYRLPTEAEWEYAARAGTTTAYSFGESSSSLGSYGWYSSNASVKTHTVAGKLPNPWGLYDMHGNVWEWVSDWYSSSYDTSTAATDPQGPGSGSFRVFRGGSWGGSASYLRSAFRNGYSPGYRAYGIGFRLLRTYP